MHNLGCQIKIKTERQHWQKHQCCMNSWEPQDHCERRHPHKEPTHLNMKILSLTNADKDVNQISKISQTTWFHHDRHATKERRGTQSHEIQQHNGSNTGFPILPSDPPHPQPCFPFNPSTVPKGRGRVDMKALICWPLCSELLCLCTCWSCSPAHPNACCC